MTSFRHRFAEAPVRALVYVVMLTFALGCGSAVQPLERVDASVQAGRSGTAAAPAGATWPPTVRVVNGALVVLGLIGTGTPCYGIEATVRTQPGMVRVQVVAVEQDVICGQVVAEFAYRVESPLDPGPQRVIVEHASRSARGTTSDFTVVRDVAVQAP